MSSAPWHFYFLTFQLAIITLLVLFLLWKQPSHTCVCPTLSPFVPWTPFGASIPSETWIILPQVQKINYNNNTQARRPKMDPWRSCWTGVTRESWKISVKEFWQNSEVIELEKSVTILQQIQRQSGFIHWWILIYGVISVCIQDCTRGHVWSTLIWDSPKSRCLYSLIWKSNVMTTLYICNMLPVSTGNHFLIDQLHDLHVRFP